MCKLKFLWPNDYLEQEYMFSFMEYYFQVPWI